jgi:hypothetical protein
MAVYFCPISSHLQKDRSRSKMSVRLRPETSTGPKQPAIVPCSSASVQSLQNTETAIILTHDCPPFSLCSNSLKRISKKFEEVGCLCFSVQSSKSIEFELCRSAFKILPGRSNVSVLLFKVLQFFQSCKCPTITMLYACLRLFVQASKRIEMSKGIRDRLMAVCFCPTSQTLKRKVCNLEACQLVSVPADSDAEKAPKI